MIGEDTPIWRNPPALLLGKARYMNPVLSAQIWRQSWIHAMNRDAKQMEAYVKGIMDTHKPHRSAILDLCAHFTILCGIDVDPHGEEATRWIFEHMENKVEET